MSRAPLQQPLFPMTKERADELIEEWGLDPEPEQRPVYPHVGQKNAAGVLRPCCNGKDAPGHSPSTWFVGGRKLGSEARKRELDEARDYRARERLGLLESQKQSSAGVASRRPTRGIDRGRGRQRQAS